MGFTNELLDGNTLPSLELLEFSPLEPSYRKIHIGIFICLALLAGISGFVASLFILDQPLTLIIGSSLAGLFLLIGIYYFFADPKKGYTIREKDLSYRCGLFFRNTVTQPINRIQHVEIRQGPIERRFKLGTLVLFSAGGQMHTFAIPGLDFTRAQTMRQFILDHKSVSKDAA